MNQQDMTGSGPKQSCGPQEKQCTYKSAGSYWLQIAAGLVAPKPAGAEAPKPAGADRCFPPPAKGAGWKGLDLGVRPLAGVLPPKPRIPNNGAGVEPTLAPKVGAPPAGA